MALRLLLFLLLAGLAHGQLLKGPGYVASLKAAEAGGGGSNPPASPLINQNFEGAGYDNSETWTEGGFPTIDEDYAGANVLLGSQSLQLDVADSSFSGTDVAFSAGSERWVSGQFKIATSRNSRFITLYSSGYGAELASVSVQGTSFRVSCGSTPVDTATTFSTGTKYYWWLRYLKGTGANAVVDFRFSTDGTKPGAGGNQAIVTDGTATADAGILSLTVNSVAGSAFVIYHDHIYVDDEEILSNP